MAHTPKRKSSFENYSGYLSNTCNDYQIKGNTILITGGGESAVDKAAKFAKNNKICLSLRSGIRLSPRIHPIRGVPSDYLRNEMLLRIKETWRNYLGHKFVRLVKMFYTSIQRLTIPKEDIWHTSDESKRRKLELNLIDNAKDKLYNVYHTKNDEFLNYAHNIELLGQIVEHTKNCITINKFASKDTVVIKPDIVIDCTGYASNLNHLSYMLSVSDFTYGVVHKSDETVFLSGYVRPVIGNIPTICELQAQLICDIIKGKVQRPSALEYHKDRINQMQKYPNLDTTSVYPTDMFPYCEKLGKRLRKNTNTWKTLLTPFTTLRYFPTEKNNKIIQSAKIYMPWYLFGILVFMPIEKITFIKS